MRQRRQSPTVFRFTAARQGLAEDVRGRQRRYLISMSIRTVAVLLGVLLWNVQRPLAVVALVVGTVLPYIAVVIANAGRENGSPLPTARLASPARDALDAAPPPAERPAGAAEEATRNRG